MNRIAKALCCASALSLAASPTWAASGFITTGQAWQLMTPQAREIYVEGLNDSANFIFVNDDLPTAIVKLARTRCLIESKITAALLAEQITNAYAQDSKLIEQAPMVLYVTRLGTICRRTINEERARFNLPPQ